VEEQELEGLTTNAHQALTELLDAAGLRAGNILVVGCSTSEVEGQRIGSASNLEIAAAIMAGILPLLRENKIYLAVQCCEHLNRAIVVEEACADKYGLEVVSVVPELKAGGAFATTAMKMLDSPVVVESIAAHAGMDIGDTFIGMHLRRVAVPVRGTIKEIGHAHLTMARTRPKLIGGERARYAAE
jgi:uncharacterized protein (TIGR01440 family)